MNTNSNSFNNKKDYLLQSLVNISTVIFFFIIVYIIYKLFVEGNYNYLAREGYQNSPDIKKDKFFDITVQNKNTIYEKSLKEIYGDNTRLMCSMLPTISGSSSICKVDNIPYIIYKYPVHIIKLIDGSILSVFNDGRMYQKDSMKSTIWKGPIENSMPQSIIPLRMITLSTDLNTLYGVGYDNILYVKEPKTISNVTSIDISRVWKKVPNNTNIIYIIFDNKTNFLLSIDINGQLFTKQSIDITSANQEVITLLDRPILRLYYDLYGYMLAIDNKFDLYQFTDIDWKRSPLHIARGANPNKLQDVLYDNDGKMYGLVFNNEKFMLEIMKQQLVFYLGDFYPLDMSISSSDTNNFIMSDQDILKCKIGSIYDYLLVNSINESTDNDPNFAHQKEILESKRKLRQFCLDRGSTTQNINYENYDLLSNVEGNDDKISKLTNIIKNLMAYEPERMKIQEKYNILNK